MICVHEKGKITFIDNIPKVYLLNLIDTKDIKIEVKKVILNKV